MPTLAALNTLSPIFHPVCITTSIVLFSYLLWATVKTASWSLASNFSPFGSYYTTLNLSRTLSITSAVIIIPSWPAAYLSYSWDNSSIALIYSISTLSMPNRSASLTSRRSLANLLIANYFSSSIIFLYRFTVPSFSFTCFVYSTRTTVISFFYFSS